MNTATDNSKENFTNGNLTYLTARLPKSFKAPFWIAKRLNDNGKLPARARFYTEGMVTRVIYGGYEDENVKAELEKIVEEHESGVLA